MRNDLPASSQGRALWFALGSLGIALLVLVFIAFTWRTVAGFQAAIDTCARLFCDFTTFYYPMGEAALTSGMPVEGFMYSPFIALLLALFSPLAIKTSELLWGFLQVGSVVLYLLLFRWLLPARLRFQLLFVIIALTSFPLWHNLSWGQVGIITTVAILGMLVLYERGRHLSASALVGLAASFKFFPLIFLAPFAFRRDFRFLLLATLACVTFFIILPGVLMGPGDTLGFYRGLLESYLDSGWVVRNYNSQYFPHVLLRISGWLGFAAHPYLPLFGIFSISLTALSLVLVYLVQRASLSHANLWSVHLLFLSIPFFLKTSWPVDLVYISFAQAYLVWQLMEAEPSQQGIRRKHLLTVVILTLLVISIGLSNIVTFNLISNYRVYGLLGYIFWADLLCLIASYILLLPRVLSPSKE
ncbi:MAG: glycosyltransferase family 87 protein [Anaerolineales bacterium]